MPVEVPISASGLVAPMVRGGIRLMPPAIRRKAFFARFGLMSYAKTLERHFEETNATRDRSAHWLAIDGAAAILDRFSIPRPEKEAGPEVWRPFLAGVVAAAKEGDVVRAKAAITGPDWKLRTAHKGDAGKVSWSFDVPAIPEDGVTVTRAPAFWRGPIRWARRKLAKRRAAT